MILTITANPTVDRVYFVDNFQMGEVHRPQRMVCSAGGKGLNVARVAHIMGEDTVAMGFVGGFNGEYIKSELQKLGIKTDFTQVDGETRICVNISDKNGLAPADDLTGKPVVMEIVPQDSVPSEPAAQGSTKHQTFKYLIPATCTIKVKDGQELLIQSRVPVYQLGVLGTMPVNATLQ